MISLMKLKYQFTEEIVDPDAIETPPDPFLGQNIDGCTTYPPSLYYKSKNDGNVKTKWYTTI